MTHSRPEYLDFEIFISVLYILTVWIPAVTGIDTSVRPGTLSALTNPFSRFNVQLAKIAFPLFFAFFSVVVLARDPGVPAWVGILDALIVFSVLVGSVIRGITRKKRAPTPTSDNADGLDYRSRIRRLEEGLLRDSRRPPHR